MIPDLIDNSTKAEDACVPANNSVGLEYYVVPSFGTVLNQTAAQCISNNRAVVNLSSNQSMYNGSVRTLWAAPNYGYFDSTTIVKPKPDSYMNYINPLSLNVTLSSNQSPMTLLSGDTYSKIEEIFSVFDKSILNQFEQ
jgi:hypothetical protein